jgi:carboxymethylenebutenolidase
MTDVTIKTTAHQLRGYLARPTGEGSWPGVIVIHDVMGMSDDLRHQADWLASASYLAVAPDFFSWWRKMAAICKPVGARPSKTPRPRASG